MTPGDVTRLLQRVASGDKIAEADLMPRVYRELHDIAGRYLRGERKEHTLSATALVSEVYLKLAGSSSEYRDRRHFFAIASLAMRRVLVDYARQRNAGKRAGIHVSLDDQLLISEEQCKLIPAMHEALERLAIDYSRQAQVVEYRYFSGMSDEEIAKQLNISSRTVGRDWEFARAWLLRELA